MKKDRLILSLIFAFIFAFSAITFSACADDSGGALPPDQTQSDVGGNEGSDTDKDGDGQQTKPSGSEGEQQTEPSEDTETDDETGGQEKEPDDETGDNKDNEDTDSDKEQEGDAEPVFALAEIGEAIKKKFECDEVLDLYEYLAPKNTFLAAVVKKERNVQRIITKVSIKDKDLNGFDRNSTNQIVEEINNIDKDDCIIQNVFDYNRTLDTDKELIEGLVKKLLGENFRAYSASITNLADKGTDIELNFDAQTFDIRILGVYDNKGKISEINGHIVCPVFTSVTGRAGFDAVLNGTAGKDYRVASLVTTDIGNAIEGYQQSVEDYNKYKQQANG